MTEEPTADGAAIREGVPAPREPSVPAHTPVAPAGAPGGPVAPGRRGAALAAWLLLVTGGALACWGAVSLAGRGPALTFAVAAPFPPLTLHLDPLGAGAALLAGILFAAAGLLRAAGVGAGGLGTILLLHLLLAAVAWFLASASPLSMLVGWEALSATTYFLLVRDRPRVRRAAWALLALSEFGAVLLFLAVLLMVSGQGPAPLLVAFLALFAFGAKAGLFPLQVWVPFAEPEAPGDVAGLFSGLLTVVAVVGYLRVVHLLAPPLFALGVTTGVFGLAGAAGSALLGLIERDAKRVLAYGTLEALGLAFTALGVGMVLQSQGAGSAAVMALGGAVALLAAHAGAKFTLFSLAGFAEERGGLRLLDRMGGLFRRQPRAAGPLLVAVSTLAGLPPCGAFLGEWLLVESCFAPTPGYAGLHVALAVVAAVVALLAATGLTVYLRWIGIGFLGPARSAAAAVLPDVPPLAAAGQWLSALLGPAAGIAAGWTLPWSAQATAWLARGKPVVAPTYAHPGAYAPIVALGAGLFRGIAGSAGNVIFAAGGFNVGSPWDLACFGLLLGLAVALVTGRLPGRPVRLVRTWVGGEPEDGLRLAWTAEGLNHPLRLTFAAFFGLQRTRLGDPAAVGGVARYRARIVLRLEHHVYRPLLALAARLSGAVRKGAQSGDLAHYVGYVLVAALLGLLAVVVLR